jgi:hypothetical protein
VIAVGRAWGRRPGGGFAVRARVPLEGDGWTSR